MRILLLPFHFKVYFAENTRVSGIDECMLKQYRGTKLAKSRAGHEKSCLNMGGPSSKAKYSSSTDSEQVP